MELNEITKMIDEYFDRELDKNKESELFIFLSANENARNYFKQQHLLKSITDEMIEDFPKELEHKILSKIITVENRRFNWQKINPIFTYSIVIILFFLSLFFFNQTNAYREDIAKIHNDIQKQNRTIELLLNSFPATEVQANFSNGVIIKAN